MRLLCSLLLVIFGFSFQASASENSDTSRLTKITAQKMIRVCIWPEYYNITYRNPKTLQLSGLDFDMANELGKDLGASVQFVNSSFSKVTEDIAHDRCDIAMFAIGITPHRKEKLRFSQPHLSSDIYAITSKSNPRLQNWHDIDQPSSVVAVSKGSLHEFFMKKSLKSAKLLILNQPFARELEVRSGRADVFMTDYPYSRRFLETDDWAKLISPPANYHRTSYAYAMKHGDDIWYERVESFMRDIKQDGRLMLSAKHHKLSSILLP
ncbi:ABC transporter substrate-binding protein [Neptunomonas japonica]|uniref:Extracellular solute-binding protein n=1 Tax=Neptunomonas japonica JAMM 1380 TaxID=1441457 RepID=A0A7R6PQL7_9GAMM|nr:ABC transporter substrate-binding protein [Neptunomonas japonica]BBB30807.1 extracellular solute-binding protein [Neptunomonas japonica JAMM 1380]